MHKIANAKPELLPHEPVSLEPVKLSHGPSLQVTGVSSLMACVIPKNTNHDRVRNTHAKAERIIPTNQKILEYNFNIVSIFKIKAESTNITQ